MSGVVAIRLLSPLGAFEGASGVMLYAAIIPVTLGFIAIGRSIAALAPGQLLRGVTVIASTAMLLDALALRLMPTLYADTPMEQFVGTAYLLWAFAVAFALALVMERQP
ncbi:hypothetical protein [Sphingomonas sp. AX6]|uniref:hypothetical protein n=1 Tax=Sphingomonas sp. AX6 TaxID=2653171 RepID=UPI0012F2D67B|nr:hypothetical protein [Sphingomonas sp. AX6]VXC41956.1 conserved membrane hypothetical protein [Sphingomonas sp. AX6]